MTYVVPELTLVGQASAVVLSGEGKVTSDPDTFHDPGAALEAEW